MKNFSKSVISVFAPILLFYICLLLVSKLDPVLDIHFFLRDVMLITYSAAISISISSDLVLKEYIGSIILVVMLIIVTVIGLNFFTYEHLLFGELRGILLAWITLMYSVVISLFKLKKK